MEKISYNEFKRECQKLSGMHQKIVSETLSRMEKKNIKHRGLPPKGYDITKNINDKRKKLHMTHKQVISMIQTNNHVRGISQTYYSMLKRRSENSILFPMVLNVLKMTPAEARKPPKNAFFIQVRDLSDYEWLYNSLSDRNKNAINYLVSALHMAEVAPEVFETSEADDVIVIKDISGNDPPIIIR